MPGNNAPYAIGDRATEWPGLSKLIEECGETLQVAGKLIATGGGAKHWDGGPPLDHRLENELGDLMAAIMFVVEVCPIRGDIVDKRCASKIYQFSLWHAEQRSDQ